MATAVVGMKFEVRLYTLFANQVYENVFHYGLASVTGTPSVKNVATDLVNALTGDGDLITEMRALIPSNMLMQKIEIQVVAPLRLRKDTFAYNLNGLGPTTQTGNLAGVVTKQGDIANKHNIGSLHIPISTAAATSANGVLSEAALEAISLVAVQVPLVVNLAGLVSASMQPVISNGKLSTEVSPITAAVPQTQVRVMRRRTVGLGQ
jgi:hypothetical protein